MARGSEQQTGTINLRLAEGWIVEQVEEGAPGAVERTNKNGKQVWERKDKFVDGIITSMYHKTHEYEGEDQHNLIIRMVDGAERYSIQMHKGSRYWSYFLTRLPNIDIGKPVRLSPYDFDDKDGKRVIGLNVFQNGNKVAPAWSKDKPGELPQPKQVRVNGKDVWDWEERNAYLEKVFDAIADDLKQGDMVMQGGTEDNEPVKVRPDQIADQDDDMPF